MSIPQPPPHIQGFTDYYRRVARITATDRQYYAIGRAALSLPSGHWYLYSMVAILANFGTRIADLAYRSRILRSWRSKRQINRILGDLVTRGYMQQHGRKLYSLTGRTQRREGARLRPIRCSVLLATSGESSGLYVRFLMALAWSRLPWGRWTWHTVQKTLKIDTGTAQQLYKAFETIRTETTRKTLRGLVFWSVRPRWYLYRTHAGQVIYDPRPAARGTIATRAEPGDPGLVRLGEIGRSGNVPLPSGPASLLWVACESSLTSTAGGRNGGGRPAPNSRRQRDRDIAATAARLAGRHTTPAHKPAHSGAAHAAPFTERDHDPAGPVDRPDLCRGTLTATTQPGRGSPQAATLPAGSLFEQLVAGLPANVRGRFEQDRATRAIRTASRIRAGYRI